MERGPISKMRVTRRDLMKALGVAAGSLGFGRSTAQGGAERRPNLLLIVTDDQRHDALSCMGNEILQTPAIDRLSHRGTRFTNAFVTTSLCPVSRASILTGQYARRNGVADFFSQIRLETTYAKLLRDAGYYTGFIGKWGTDENNSEYFGRVANLFDYWGGSMGQANFWHERTCNYVQNDGISAKDSFHCDCPPDERGTEGDGIRHGKAGMKDPVHLSTYIIPKKARDFFESWSGNEPFCLSISMKGPHGPYDYDPRFAEAFEGVEMPMAKTATSEAAERLRIAGKSLASGRGRKHVSEKGLEGSLQAMIRNYFRLMLGVDFGIGEILSELEKRKLSQNTVVIFTSDNGHFFGEHGLAGKWLMYEESIRIPLIISDPRRPKSQVSEEMVLNIDIAPTLLDFARLPIPDSMQGKSLRPLLANPQLPFREAWFYEQLYGHAENPPKHIERCEGVRTRDWKYIKYLDHQGPDSEELYHLAQDPFELGDLAEDPKHAAQRTKLLALLEEMRESLR